MHAVDDKDINEIKSIINNATNLNILSDLIDKTSFEKGQSALWRATSGGSTEIVQILLDNKADVNLAAKKGASPLFIASAAGHLDIVKCLIDHKAAVDQAMNDGSTPFLAACFEGHLQTLKILIQHGADPYKQTDCGITGIYLAEQLEDTDVEKYLKSLMKN